jgi:hypothetical protein
LVAREFLERAKDESAVLDVSFSEFPDSPYLNLLGRWATF